jgi:hypothetical protein
VLHYEAYGDLSVLVQSALPVWEGDRAVDPGVRTAAMRAVAEHAGVRTAAVGDSEWGRELAARLEKVAEPVPRERLAAVLAEAADRRLPFGAWHGDWTPWNMTVRAGRALVWDWERFTVGVPVGFDAVHYALQAALWRRGADPRAVTAGVLAGAPALLAPFGLDAASATAVARLYLVEIGGRYLIDGQAAAGARLGQVERWLLPALTGDDSSGAGAPVGKDGPT